MSAAKSRRSDASDDAPVYVAAGLTLLLGPLTGVVGWVLRGWLYRNPKQGALAALAGVAVAALFHGVMLDSAGAAGHEGLAAASPMADAHAPLAKAVVW